MRVYTRYDLPDDKDETRRERNIKFGQGESPKVNIPEYGRYLWDLYTNLSNAIHRVDFNGYYYNLQPSEILAWCKLTGNSLEPFEYEIISAMDNAFCREINTDKKARDERKLEEQKEEAQKRRRK